MLVLLRESRTLFLGFGGERTINNNLSSQVMISKEIDQAVGNQNFVFGRIGVVNVAWLSTAVFLIVLPGAPCSAPDLQTALPRTQ